MSHQDIIRNLLKEGGRLRASKKYDHSADASDTVYYVYYAEGPKKHWWAREKYTISKALYGKYARFARH